MGELALNWIDYLVIVIALSLLIYFSYRYAAQLSKLQTSVLSERLEQNTRQNENRIRCQPINTPHTPTFYTVAAVVMSTNPSSSTRNTENTENVQELPPSYDEAIFYPISKAMVTVRNETEPA
ncbi:unnamed protein product [Hermetia illucens]|uniref:Uncharacterized protein n=1 Tax=Hermetia illucens TaxID=343691 RepID=A0A7R8UCV5_HERIL|nr:uncharacterized protein LOC119661167 [Hermetia illucens]CAD7078214.1 unnamed protein product [Hermetia illucens]